MAEPSPIRQLFARYKAELRALYEVQIREREELIRRIMDRDGVDEETAREIDLSENDVLVHDGRAIHIIRKYWLEVDRMKKEEQKAHGGWVEPLTFLVEYMGEEPDGEDLVEYLTQIAYWPIGLDENGEWT
jgi:hypothetical protein